MNELIEDLKQTNLFSGIEPQEIDGLLHCLCARYVRYVKGDRIIEEGNKVYDFGIMLSGHGRAIKWDSSDHTEKILTYLWRIIGKSFPDQWQVVISIIRPGRNRNS